MKIEPDDIVIGFNKIVNHIPKNIKINKITCNSVIYKQNMSQNICMPVSDLAYLSRLFSVSLRRLECMLAYVSLNESFGKILYFLITLTNMCHCPPSIIGR